MTRRTRNRRTRRPVETVFPFTVLGGMPYSDLPLRKELVVRREVREPFFEVLKQIPIRHLEGLTEIIAGKFQDQSMFAPDGLYYPNLKTIIVSSRANTPLTLAHEIGHHVYDHVLSNKQRLKWRKIVKDKFPEAKTSFHFREFFAESYTRHYTPKREGLFPIMKRGQKKLGSLAGLSIFRTDRSNLDWPSNRNQNVSTSS